MSILYGEDEDDVPPGGLFGKAVYAVDIAKDIAYLIWNVGWE